MLVQPNYQISLVKGNKDYLTKKVCLVCEKPFTWRKKWEKNRENVKYCSARCKSQKKLNKNKAFI